MRRSLQRDALLGIACLLIGSPLLAENPPATEPDSSWQTLLENFSDVAAAELSAALRDAYDAHIGTARPLPEPVKQFLHGILPDAIIDRARYVVSVDDNTLPGLLNQGHRVYRNEDNAVSIDNLIIFSREPTFASGTDARWWAHELGHHLQYRRLGGIDGFSREYVKNFQAMEREAETYGEQALHKYVQLYR